MPEDRRSSREFPQAPASVRGDVAALAAMVRDSAGEGERAAARFVADRLAEEGVSDIRLDDYEGRRSYAPVHGLHMAAGLLFALRSGLLARVAALAALVSLELDASGRRPWLHRLLPTGTGTNVIARIPPRDGGPAFSTVVLVAHHDAARTGLVWHPALSRVARGRRLRSRRIDGFMLPVAAGLLLAALPLRAARAAGAGLLAVATAAVAQVGFGRTVPGASDNASGVAALIALAGELAAEPLEGVDVLIWSVGCEESGMDGMRAALAGFERSGETLFIGLDTLGAGTPIVASGEGTILEHRYRPDLLDLVDRAARNAGLECPERWRIGGWTDPILAAFDGHAAISLLSIGPDGIFTEYHLPSDTADRVDFDSVAGCIDLARAVIGEFAGQGSRVGG